MLTKCVKSAIAFHIDLHNVISIICCFFLKFIDFKMGDESGFIRFEDPDAANNARAAALISEDESFTVKKSVLTLQSVTGNASL